MGNIVAHGLANGSRIGMVPIGGHLIRNMAHDCNCPLQKVLSRLDVEREAEHRVHQMAIVVDGSIERAPFPMDFDRGFIDVPGFPGLLLSFAA